MKITKRFYQQAQFAWRSLDIGDYYPTITYVYKSGGSPEKRREFFNLYYHFLEIENNGIIVIHRMGVITANKYMFTFACSFIEVKTGILKCYYTTPYNSITIDCEKNMGRLQEKSK